MREALAERHGLRGRFTATFTRSGLHTRGGHPVTRLLFHGVKDESGLEVTDHIWFTETPTWRAFKLQPGETVRFEARVSTYWKGYRGDRSMDYKLNNPNRIVVTSRPVPEEETFRLKFPDEIA